VTVNYLNSDYIDDFVEILSEKVDDKRGALTLTSNFLKRMSERGVVTIVDNNENHTSFADGISVLSIDFQPLTVSFDGSVIFSVERNVLPFHIIEET